MKKSILVFLLTGVIGISCSKTNSDLLIPYADNPINDTTWSATPNENAVSNTLFAAFAQAPFIDSFDVSGSALLRIDTELDLAIPANSLVFENGASVPAGKVRAEISYCDRRGDFVRYARPTTSYGQLMESIGGFDVRFYRQDQVLLMKPGKKLFFTLRNDNPVSSAEVYFGERPVMPYPFGTNPFFAWQTATDSSFIVPFTHVDPGGAITKGYQIFVGKTGWINCMTPVDTTGTTTTNMHITLAPNFTNNNTAVFVVIKNQKSVVQLNGNAANQAFSTVNVPVGKNVQLVTLSRIGGQYYLGFKELTVTKNMVTMVNPAAKSLTEIDQFLSGL